MRISRVVAAVATVVALLIGFAVPAEAATTVSITVRIKDNWGPLTKGCITVKSPLKTAKDCTVNSAGNFTFVGLPKASYSMYASGFPLHLDRTLPTATFWSSNTYSTNQLLKRYGYLHGKVKSTTGVAIAGATVSAIDDPSAGAPAPTVSTTTRADGTYDLWLPVSSYYRVTVDNTGGYGRFPFDLGMVARYRVGSDSSVVFSPELAPAGVVTGTLTAPPGINASTVCASIHTRQNGLNYGSWCGAPGDTYTISDLTPGSYVMCVGTSPVPATCKSDVPGVREMVGFASDMEPYGNDPAAVNITSGQTTTFDPAWGGTAAVKVALDNGAVASGGCLRLEVPSRDVDVSACDPINGVYTLVVPADLETGASSMTLSGADNARDQVWPYSFGIANGGSLAPTVSGTSEGTGSLTLDATGPGGAVLTSGCAYLLLWHPNGYVTRTEEMCDLSAPVVFDRLAPGEYSVGVKNVADSFTQWWAPGVSGNYPLATKYTLADGGALEVDLAVPTTQTFKGKVTDANGDPRVDGTVDFVVGITVVSSVAPSADGTYELATPIVLGKLRLTGFGETVEHWWGNFALKSQTLAMGGPAYGGLYQGANFKVGAPSHITGSLALPPRIASSTACVYAVPASNHSAGSVASFCGEQGDAFSLLVLPGTSYDLCLHSAPTATPCAGSTATWEEFGDDTTSVALPQAGGEVPVNVAFGGTIRVTPTGEGGATVTGGCAQLIVGGVGGETTCERDAGAFVFTVGNDLQYNDASVELTDLDGRLDKSLSVGRVSGGAVVALSVATEQWGAISGTITRPVGFADTTVCVLATDTEGFDAETCLDPGVSAYSLRVKPGHVYLLFYAQEPGVAFEWHQDSSTLHHAGAIEMDSSGWQVNATLAAAGTIAGHVAGPGGSIATGGCAIVISLDGWRVDEACGGPDGDYSLPNLPAGKYKLQFTDFDGLVTGWYGGANFGSATTITVTAGAIANADAELAMAGTVAGHVTYDGAPALGGCVDLVDGDGFTVATGCVDDDGAYVIDDAPQGDFYLYFNGFDGAADTWSGGVAAFSESAPVHVTSGSSTPFDVVLDRAGVIAGTVPDLGSGYDGQSVMLIDSQGEVIASQAVAPDPDILGSGPIAFSFDHVAQGTYKVLWRAGGEVRSYYTASGAIAPTAVTVSSATQWTFTGLTIAYPSNAYRAGFYGYLNVPSSWKSPIVCAVAVYSTGGVASSDCGPRGGFFELRKLAPGKAYKIVFTNGVVTTKAAYSSFTGSKKWFGNVTSYVPAYYPGDGPVAYLPVWFYSDVTYKTPSYFAVSWMGDQGLFGGYSDGSFKPANTLTRRDFAIYLYKLAGSPVVALPSASPFSDVPTTDPAYKALLWMRNHSYWTSTSYKPTSALERRTEALVLYRFAGSPAVTLPAKSPFTDVAKTDFAYKAILWANKNAIVPKATTTTFAPNNTVKRSSGAASLYEFWWRFG